MTLQSARLTLKQHRFEIATAAFGSIVLGALALWVNWRLVGIDVPAGCFDAWMGGGGTGGRECDDAVSAFLDINEDQAGKVFAGMAVLPFAVGLLGGVTLVGRELEARTAQMAWALAASRRRWFGRQLWPILLVLGVTVTFAAGAAGILEETRRSSYAYFFMDFGLYGPIVVARAFAALGLGLLTGAALARTLPAFIVGALLSMFLLSAATGLRDAWIQAQPPVVFDEAVTQARDFDGILFEQAWQAPDGTIIREEDAMALIPTEGAADPYMWLIDHGYEVVQLGITAETARGWEPLEIAGWSLTGFVLILGTIAIIDRRRPT